MTAAATWGRVTVMDGPLMRRQLGRRFHVWIVGPYAGAGARQLGHLARGRTLIVGLGCGYTLDAALECVDQVVVLEADADVLEAWARDPRTLPTAWERPGQLVEMRHERLEDHRPDQPYDLVLCDLDPAVDRLTDLQAIDWPRLLVFGGQLVLPAGWRVPAWFKTTAGNSSSDGKTTGRTLPAGYVGLELCAS